MKKISLISFLVSFSITFLVISESAISEENVVLINENLNIYGSLLAPEKSNKVALIISGSGPTDRNGNSPNLKNDSLKKLAFSLKESGIASLRYDKRGIAESSIKNLDESKLLFEDYVEDASLWIKWLKQKNNYNEITVIGHSEGSLIGMIAAEISSADKFVSLAGPGKSADRLLKEQLSKQKLVSRIANPLIDELVAGKQVIPPPFLKALFRPSVQPYLISWFKYDPSIEIAKLQIPSLIIQGSHDIQVSVEDARILFNSTDKADLKIIDGMNHILINTPLDREANLASYNQPEKPINTILTNQIVRFIDP